jgi:hypothetical protein
MVSNTRFEVRSPRPGFWCPSLCSRFGFCFSGSNGGLKPDPRVTQRRVALFNVATTTSLTSLRSDTPGMRTSHAKVAS